MTDADRKGSDDKKQHGLLAQSLLVALPALIIGGATVLAATQSGKLPDSLSPSPSTATVTISGPTVTQTIPGPTLAAPTVTVSPPTVTVTAKPTTAALPSGGKYLSDLVPADNKYSALEAGKVEWRGQPPLNASLVAGSCYDDPSTIYVVPDDARSFVAEVGLTEDSVSSNPSTFNFRRDGDLYSEASVSLTSGKHAAVEIPVDDTTQLTLEIDQNHGCGDVVNVWGNARFLP